MGFSLGKAIGAAVGIPGDVSNVFGSIAKSATGGPLVAGMSKAQKMGAVIGGVGVASRFKKAGVAGAKKAKDPKDKKEVSAEEIPYEEDDLSTSTEFAPDFLKFFTNASEGGWKDATLDLFGIGSTSGSDEEAGFLRKILRNSVLHFTGNDIERWDTPGALWERAMEGLTPKPFTGSDDDDGNKGIEMTADQGPAYWGNI